MKEEVKKILYEAGCPHSLLDFEAEKICQLTMYGDDYIKLRFWDKVRINKDTGCWEWIGSLQNMGYGKLSINGQIFLAYRIAYKLMKGDIPNELEIDHLCRNKKCVNPAHLERASKGQISRE